MTVDAMRRSLDAKVNWGITVIYPDGTKKTSGGELRVVSYFPTSDYEAKLQTHLNLVR